MQCEIKSIDEIDIAAWDYYIMTSTGNPAQLAIFANLISKENAKPIFIIIKDAANVVFQWLLVLRGKPGFYFLQAMAEPTAENYEYISYALSEIKKKYTPFKFVFLDLAFSRFKDKEILERLGFVELIEYQANRVDLRQTEEELFKGIHSKHRNSIRRAERSQVSCYEGKSLEDVKKYYALSEATYRRSKGNNVDQQIFLNMYEVLHELGKIRFVFSESDGEIQAGACIVTSGSVAIYWKGATKEKEVTGAANLLHWEIMKMLKAEGVVVYDLSGNLTSYESGSKREGIIRFKHRFGGQIETYYGGVKVFCPWKNILYKLYQYIKR